jgi:hypothetical protein
MRLVMTLVVRDESDVLAATIEHHLASGVDFIVATDNGSRDGTAELLAAYQDAGVLEFRVEPDLKYDQARWVTAMARRAAEVHQADWVINADADEFWWPRDGASLAAVLDMLPAQYSTVEAPRENLVADTRPSGAGPWPDRLTLRDLLSLHERGGRIGPKTCHRGDGAVNIAHGNHGVTGQALGSHWSASPITILHAPDRSYEQFARKIENGGASLVANAELDPEICWHWRADYARLLDGTLYSSWLARQLDAEQIEAGLASGRLVPDSRLRTRLSTLLDHAVLPTALRAVLAD